MRASDLEGFGFWISQERSRGWLYVCTAVRYHPKDEEKGGLSSGLTWESANIEEYLVMNLGLIEVGREERRTEHSFYLQSMHTSQTKIHRVSASYVDPVLCHPSRPSPVCLLPELEDTLPIGQVSSRPSNLARHDHSLLHPRFVPSWVRLSCCLCLIHLL